MLRSAKGSGSLSWRRLQQERQPHFSEQIGISVLVVAERESLKGGKIRGLSKAGLTFAIILIDYHRFGRAEIRLREATLVLGEASELTVNRTGDASDVVRGRA